jgi:hypothetical protein
MAQPATSTDRLANVIQVIQLGHKTGTLTVERDSSSGPEQGIILFVNGQVARASLHQHEGTLAFKQLNTWSACRFTFTPSTSSTSPAKLPAVQSGQSLNQRMNGNATGDAIARPGREDTGIHRWHSAPGVDIPPQHRSLEEALQLIDRATLSRAHRRLYLLIDGHRSSTELARLMGRSQSEIDALLQDIERAGVIRR